MPLYRVLTRPGLLSPEQRQAFSQDVVEVHCRVTQAPPSFVHVLYLDDHQQQLPEGCVAMVANTIRLGRTEAQKQTIRDDLSSRLAVHASAEPSAVKVVTADIDASYVMEGGRLLPEPGSEEEKAWTSS